MGEGGSIWIWIGMPIVKEETFNAEGTWFLRFQMGPPKLV